MRLYGYSSLRLPIPPFWASKNTDTYDDRLNAFNQQFNQHYCYSMVDLISLRSDIVVVQHDSSKAQQTLQNTINKQYQSDKPIPGIYHRDGNHWTAFVVVSCKEDGQDVTKILMKDSKYNKPSQDFVKCIKKLKNDQNKLELIYNSNTEQKDIESCGVFALRNIEIIQQELQELQEKSNDFIKSFQTYDKFCKQTDIEDLRKKYGNKILDSYTKDDPTAVIAELLEPLKDLLLDGESVLNENDQQNLVKIIEEKCSGNKVVTKPATSNSSSDEPQLNNDKNHKDVITTEEISDDKSTTTSEKNTTAPDEQYQKNSVEFNNVEPSGSDSDTSWFGKCYKYYTVLSNLFYSTVNIFAPSNDPLFTPSHETHKQQVNAESEIIKDSLFGNELYIDSKYYISTDFEANYTYIADLEIDSTNPENHWDVCGWG